jgi:hypothetical protein
LPRERVRIFGQLVCTAGMPQSSLRVALDEGTGLTEGALRLGKSCAGTRTHAPATSRQVVCRLHVACFCCLQLRCSDPPFSLLTLRLLLEFGQYGVCCNIGLGCETACRQHIGLGGG